MALGDVIARLSVHLGLETAAFEKGSKRAETRMSGFQKNMSRASTAVKTAFVGMLGVFAVDQIVSVAKAGLEYASSLGEVAQQLGVTTKALQEYRYAASQAGIEQDEMDKGLSKLSVKIGQAADGNKSAVAVFKDLGISIRDSNGNVRDTGDILPEVAEAYSKLGSQAEKTALSAEVFGAKLGPKFNALLEGGAAGINSLRDAAHELGIVLSEEEIQNADDTADKLSAMKQVLEAKIASSVAQNADAILVLVDALTRLAAAAGNALSAWNKWRGASEQNAKVKDPGYTGGLFTVRPATETPMTTRQVPLTNGLGQTFTGTKRIRLPKGGRGGGGGANAFGSLMSLGQSPGAFATKAAEGGLVRMAQAANDVDKPIAAVERNLSSVATKAAPKTVEALKKIKVELEELRRTTQGIFDRLFPDEADARRYAEEITVLNTALAKGQITADDHTRAIAALRREYSGFADEMEKASVVVSQNFGPSLDEISDEISNRLPDTLSRLAGNANVATVRVAKSFNDMAQDVLGSLNQLSSSIKGGGFLNILTSVVGLGLQLGGAGLFGKKIQTNINRVPGYANGTNFARGGLSLVGERGPELVNLPRGASVTPNNKLGGMGSVATVVPSPYFDVVVDGRILRASPSIASAGAAGGVSQMQRSGRRRVG